MSTNITIILFINRQVTASYYKIIQKHHLSHIIIRKKHWGQRALPMLLRLYGYLFIAMSAMSQSLSGRVMSLALLYAICNVKIVRPS